MSNIYFLFLWDRTNQTPILYRPEKRMDEFRRTVDHVTGILEREDINRGECLDLEIVQNQLKTVSIAGPCGLLITVYFNPEGCRTYVARRLVQEVERKASSLKQNYGVRGLWVYNKWSGTGAVLGYIVGRYDVFGDIVGHAGNSFDTKMSISSNDYLCSLFMYDSQVTNNPFRSKFKMMSLALLRSWQLK